MRLFEGTEFDRPPRCDECGELEVDCQCPTPPPLRIPPGEQTARVSIEKRKKGKVVTVIHGLPAAGNDLRALLTKLKGTCGAGGTVRDEVIEIQGKHSERVQQVLLQLGYKVGEALEQITKFRDGFWLVGVLVSRALRVRRGHERA